MDISRHFNFILDIGFGYVQGHIQTKYFGFVLEALYGETVDLGMLWNGMIMLWLLVWFG